MTVSSEVLTAAERKEPVFLVVVEDDGHTWPGQQPPFSFIGTSATSVNEVMWQFFQTHELK